VNASIKALSIIKRHLSIIDLKRMYLIANFVNRSTTIFYFGIVCGRIVLKWKKYQRYELVKDFFNKFIRESFFNMIVRGQIDNF
jgi:hypothetical protein